MGNHGEIPKKKTPYISWVFMGYFIPKNGTPENVFQARMLPNPSPRKVTFAPAESPRSLGLKLGLGFRRVEVHPRKLTAGEPPK